MKVQAINFATVSQKRIVTKQNPSFKAYGHDDMSAYDNYSGPKPPDIEIYKYNKSREASELIERGRYREAANIKMELAEICRIQGKHEDAEKLKDGAHRLIAEI